MTKQIGKVFYKVATKTEQPWMTQEVAIFKRVGPFHWEPIDMHFDTVEDAEAYLGFIGMPGVAS